MSDFETHPVGTADLVKMQQNLEHWRQEVGKLHSRVATLTDQLTRANAASAAAYEVAGATIEMIVSDAQKEVGSIKLSKVDAAVVEMLNGIANSIRALATPDQTAALDKLIAEAVADRDAKIEQLNQDLIDMRDNVEIAYYRGYWAGGNGE